MKKLIIILGGIVVIGGLAAAGYNLGNNSNPENSESLTENSFQEKTEKLETSEDKEISGGDGTYYETLTDLMARGKSMRCTYTHEINSGGTAAGVVHMADKNALTEITVKEANAPFVTMYALINQEWMYSWTDGSSQGYKMTVEAGEMSEKNKETMSNMSKEIDFKCRLWIKDSSKFKVPTNIEFEDMSEVMGGLGDIDIAEEIKNAEDQSKEFLCEHCKNAPTPELMKECLGDVVCD